MLGSLIILIVILWLGPLFEPLPKACLASIICIALKGLLFQVKQFFYLWRCNKYEAVKIFLFIQIFSYFFDEHYHLIFTDPMDWHVYQCCFIRC